VWHGIVCTALATQNTTESNCIIQQAKARLHFTLMYFNCGTSFRGHKHRTLAFPKCKTLPNSTANPTVSNCTVKMCHECLLPCPSQFTVRCLFCHCTATWQERLAARLGKLVNVGSCLNCKLSKHTYLCLSLIYTRRDWLWWMEDRERPRMHKHREITKNLNYCGSCCTSRHFRFGT